MGKIVIKDDDAIEILDYLIKQNESYAEYLAENLFMSLSLKGDYIAYAKNINQNKGKING